jgi:hypothetical protein
VTGERELETRGDGCECVGGGGMSELAAEQMLQLRPYSHSRVTLVLEVNKV